MKGGVKGVEGVRKCRTKFAIAMVCLWELGFGEVIKRVKISESGVYATAFLVLQGRVGDCKEGVLGFWWGEN